MLSGPTLARDGLKPGGQQLEPYPGGGRDRGDASDGAINKQAADDALDKLTTGADDFISAEAVWQRLNYNQYIGYARDTPGVSWTQDAAQGALSNAFGNAVADGATWVAKKVAARGLTAASTAVGAAIGNVPGAIVGFVVGVLLETAAGMLYETLFGSPSDDAATEAAVRTAALISTHDARLEQQSKAARSHSRERIEQMRQRLADSNDPVEVDNIGMTADTDQQDLANHEPDIANRSLADQMIAEWVLEHAGDEEDENSDVTGSDWDAAREMRFGGDLDNRPELFAFQTRNQFGKMGLDTQLIQQTITALRPDLSGAATFSADAVASTYHGKRFEFNRASDPEKLINFIADNYGWFPSEHGKQAIREGRFRLECTLDVSSADGSVYIDEWEYAMTFEGDEDTIWWQRTSLAHQRINPVLFDVSPD